MKNKRLLMTNKPHAALRCPMALGEGSQKTVSWSLRMGYKQMIHNGAVVSGTGSSLVSLLGKTGYSEWREHSLGSTTRSRSGIGPSGRANIRVSTAEHTG